MIPPPRERQTTGTEGQARKAVLFAACYVILGLLIVLLLPSIWSAPFSLGRITIVSSPSIWVVLQIPFLLIVVRGVAVNLWSLKP